MSTSVINWKWIITTISLNILFSIIGYVVIIRVISKMKYMFIKAGIFGIDMNKPKKGVAGESNNEDSLKIPEGQGVIAGCIFLIVMFLFIPVAFYDKLGQQDEQFPFDEYVKYLSGLLSICCMIFLGFADDVLDLRWLHKLLLPTIASLPLLMVYFVSFDLTIIIVPQPFRQFIGFSIDIGILYYVYMGMLAIFCTNSINILAGVNGIEAGQSLVISSTVIVFNVIELGGNHTLSHIFSLYFMIPFTAVCAALLKLNWYPAEIFVGDTFCYFAGMTFAVVAILGHFSKTMLLFFIPQTINFVMSCPQLFHILPCPRHRLPRLNTRTNKLEPSFFTLPSPNPSLLQSLVLRVFLALRLTSKRETLTEDKRVTEYANFTLINAVLATRGATHERDLTSSLMLIQTLFSALALVIRYPLARLLYNT